MTTQAQSVLASNLAAARSAWWLMFAALGGDISPDYLCAWVALESGGNVCDMPSSTGEAGIFQLMPPDNINEAGTTSELLRDGCADGSPTLAARIENVTSGVRYINAQRAKVESWAPWASSSSTDYWSLVKMCHVAPAVVKTYGPSSTSWDDFAQQASDGGYQHGVENAAAVGAYGTSPWLVGAAKVAALVGGLWLAQNVRRRAA